MEGISSPGLNSTEDQLPLFLRKGWTAVARGEKTLVELEAVRDGAVVGRLSYVVRPGLLGIPIATMPYWTPYGGVVLSPTLPDADKLNVAQDLLLQLPKHLSIEFQCPSHLADADIIKKAYQAAGFSISGNKTRLLHPDQAGIFVANPIDELGLQAQPVKTSKKNFVGAGATGAELSASNSRSPVDFETGESLGKTRSQIRNASKGLKVVSLSPGEFINVYAENLNGVRSKEPLPTLRNLIAYGLTNKQIRIFAAHRKDEVEGSARPPIDAAIACAYDDDRYYVWRMTVRKHHAGNEPRPHPHATKLVLVHAMRHARSLGLVFDTEGGATGQTEELYPRLRISDEEVRLVATRYRPIYSLIDAAKDIVKDTRYRLRRPPQKSRESSPRRRVKEAPEPKTSKISKFIVPFNKGKAGKIPLYLVHPLTGEVGTFGPFAKFLAAEQPVYGIQVPRPLRVPGSARSIEEMAAIYVGELNKCEPSGPLVLGGWSMGGLIALEMAQQLRAQDRKDILLVNIDGEVENTGARTSRKSPLYWAGLAANFVPWIIHEEPLKNWSIRSLTRRVAAKAIGPIKSRYAAIRHGTRPRSDNIEGWMDPSAFTPEEFEFMKAAYRAFEIYVPRPYCGPVIAYEASVGPLGRLPEIAKTWGSFAPELLVIRINGTHASIFEGKNGRELGNHLQGKIDEFTENFANGNRLRFRSRL